MKKNRVWIIEIKAGQSWIPLPREGLGYFMTKEDAVKAASNWRLIYRNEVRTKCYEAKGGRDE